MELLECKNLCKNYDEKQVLKDVNLKVSSGKIIGLLGKNGTGKTTLVSALIQILPQLRLRTVLLAPTGRAAKVLSNYSGKKAYTIHKKIYYTATDEYGAMHIARAKNKHKYTLFIVDEASMIGETLTTFGGRV